MQRVIDLMQERVNEFGVSEAEVFQSGEDQIEVNVPGVSDAGRAARPGRLHRPAVLLRLGSEHPRRGLQDRPGPQREHSASRSTGCTRGHAGVQVQERRRRQGLDPLAEDSPGGQSQAAAEPRFYVFDKNTKKPLPTGRRSIRGRTRSTR